MSIACAVIFICNMMQPSHILFFFFFNDTATTEIYTLSLHDALPISYISQSDKGELVIGAGTDAYTSYTQRGGLHITSHALEAICELFPMFRRLRMLRNWGGIVDVTPDRSPIIARTPVPGLYVNCGWGTGGVQGTPGFAPRVCLTLAPRPAAPHHTA